MRSLILAATALTPLFAAAAGAQAPVAQMPDPGLPAAPVSPAASATPGGFRPVLQPTYAPTDVGRVRAGADTSTSTGVTRVDIGGGLMIEEDAPKSRSTVTQDFMQKQVPTGNVYSAIRLMPGANVSLNDAYGLNGGNITLRGLNSDQIGLTVNGVPVNDSGNYAVFPQEYVDIENLRQVVVSQGSQDLDAPHIGAVGGTINTYMRDPRDKAGGFVDFSYGSNHLVRTFARIETGLIGPTKSYLSVSHAQDEHFRGPGGDDRNHVDFASVTKIGEASRVSVFINYNDAVNNNYLNPNLAQITAAGGNPRKPGYVSQYNAPIAVNGTNSVVNQSLITNTAVGTTASGNYYQLRVNPFRNLIVSAPASFSLTDSVSVDVTPYFWYGNGNGGGSSTISEGGNNFYGIGTQYRLTPGDLNGNGQSKDTLLFYTPSVTETIRPGVYTTVNYTVDDHRLKAGYHFEWANHRQTGPYSYVNNNGTPNDLFGGVSAPLLTPSGRQFEFRNQLTNTFTNQVFVGDTWSLLNDRLAIDVGLREAFVTRNGSNYIPGATPKLSLNKNETLPSASVRFKLNDENQVFASVGTGYRVPANFTLFDTFSTSTGARLVASKADQQTEESTSFELGHRYQGSVFTTSATAFGYLFRNRQISTTVQDPVSGGLFTTNINAGQQTSIGLDAEIGLRPINNFRPYVSAEYLHAEIRSNYPVTQTIGGKPLFDNLPTKGRSAVRSPEFQAALGLDYDDGTFFGNAAVKYIDHQFSTFTNDQQIPHIVTADLTLGYRLPDVWKAKRPELRLNLINISDEKFLSGVSSIGVSSKTQTGIRGTTIPSQSTPSYYVGGGFAAVITLSSAF